MASAQSFLNRAGRGESGVQQPVVQVGVHLLVLGERVRHDQAAVGRVQRLAGAHHRGDLSRRVDLPVEGVP